MYTTLRRPKRTIVDDGAPPLCTSADDVAIEYTLLDACVAATKAKRTDGFLTITAYNSTTGFWRLVPGTDRHWIPDARPRTNAEILFVHNHGYEMVDLHKY